MTFKALMPWTAIIVVAALSQAQAAAQTASGEAPAIGEHVKLTLVPSRDQLVATVVATNADHITVQPASSLETRQIPWADVGGLKVSRGKHGNTLKGVLVGAAAWAATVGLMATFDTLDESGLGEPLVIGGYLGAGALVGSLVKTERWKDVALPAPAGTAERSARGLRFQVSVRF